MTVADRTALMFRLARIMEANARLLTELDIIDNGMPMFIAGLTTANCVEMVDYYAGAIMRIEGTTTAPPRHIAAETEALTYTLREPVGVAGLIVPWNVPLSTAILKLAPALAAGCTVVIKPSEETPLSALALGQMMLDAGFPAGVVNMVNGLGAEAGAALAAHPGVDKISFTGSTATGRKIVDGGAGQPQESVAGTGRKVAGRGHARCRSGAGDPRRGDGDVLPAGPELHGGHADFCPCGSPRCAARRGGGLRQCDGAGPRP